VIAEIDTARASAERRLVGEVFARLVCVISAAKTDVSITAIGIVSIAHCAAGA
jgi:hypothetical protein